MPRLLPSTVLLITAATYGQIPGMPDPTRQQTYTLHRSSSRESTGANADARTVTPGQTLTVLDVDGPGMVSHIWFTLDDSEPYALKRIVLRMYWDGEASPSVETPIGDFFGLGNGIWKDTCLGSQTLAGAVTHHWTRIQGEEWP
ncbi:MAG TPA: DUF2961 domain-containing protein [Candidatus Sulfotelmatobacter sp.]